MSKNKKHLHILVLVVSLSFLMFNELGIIKLISIYNQRLIVENEIQELIAEEIKLINEINLLQTDPEYIKEVAREKFHMCSPGEKIFRIKTEKILE